jgi:hypothetical protein
LLDWVKNSKDNQITGFKNHYWNGLTCLEYSQTISEIIEDINICNFKGKIKHIGSNKISKYNLLKLYTSIFEIDKDIIGTNKNNCDRSLILDIKRKDITLQLLDLKKYYKLIKNINKNIFYSNEIEYIDCNSPLIFITSIINVNIEKDIYVSTKRSLFTRKERFIQTLDQLKSLKLYKEKNNYKFTVIILEQSRELNQNEIDLLCIYSDTLILFSKDELCNNYSNLSYNKSLGEIYVVKKLLGFIKDRKNTTFCKFSGRYNINNYFDLNRFLKKSCVKEYKGIYTSVFYSIYGCADEYYNLLDYCLNNKEEVFSAEHALTEFFLFYKIDHTKLDVLGVCGNCAVSKDYFEF